jgi:hypothetical protein
MQRTALTNARNHADDIDAPIWLFRTLRHVPSMADAITIWAEDDLQIADLNEQTHHVRQRILEGGVPC